MAWRGRRQIGALVVAVAIAAALAACGGSSGGDGLGIIAWPDDAVATGPEPGQRAPNFRLETVTGETLVLAEQTGQPTLLNFFASWCTNCREEMAALQEASAAGVTVIGVNLREGPEKVATLARETGATFPLALDRKGTVTRAYRVTNLPATFVLDADGAVHRVIRGPVDAATIQEALAGIDSALAPAGGA